MRYTLLKGLVSLSLILILLNTTDLHLLVETISTIKPSSLISSLFLYLIAQAVSTYRWSLLIPEDVRIPFRRLFSLYLIGMFFNNLLPTSVGGDVVRSYYLFKNCGKGSVAVASVFMERYMGLTALFSILLLSLLLEGDIIRGTKVLPLSLLLFFLFLLGSLLLWNRRFHLYLADLLDRFRLQAIRELTESFTTSMNTYRNQAAIIGKTFLLSLLIQILGILVFFQLSKGIGMELPLLYFFLFIPIAIVMSMIPVSLAGIGVRDGMFVYLFSIAGEPPFKALSLSLTWFFMVLIISLSGGIEYIRRGSLPDSSLKGRQ